VTGTLVRADPALRHLHKWTAISLLSAALFLNVVAYARLKVGGEVWGALDVWYIVLAWLVLAAYLVLGQVRTRCSSFGMTLPLPSLHLWRAHVLAVLAGGALLLAAVTAAVVLGGVLLSNVFDAGAFSAGEVAIDTLRIAALFILAVAALELRAPAMSRAPLDAAGVATTLSAALAILPAALWLLRLPAVAALVPLLAAVGLGAIRIRALPETFSLAPDRAGAAAAGTAGAAGWDDLAPRSALSRWMLVNTVVLRSMFRRKAAPWLIIPFLLFFGVLLAGIDEPWSDENLRSLFIALTAYILMSFMVEPMLQLQRVETFAISRRRLFALLVLPSLITITIGYVGARVYVESRAARGDLPEAIELFQAKDGYFYTRVPARFCQLSRTGEVPRNTAPWGESYPAWSTPLYRGSGVRLYSPFSIGEGASVEFAALQISRAAEAIIGEAITPEEIRRRYLRERDDGSVALATESLTLQRDFHLKTRYAGPMFPVVLTLASVIWLVTLRVYFAVFRAGVSKRRRKGVGFGLMGALFAVYIVQMVLASSGIMDVWVQSGFLEILVRRASDAFAGGGAVVWGACIAVFALLYRWVERRFERVEVLVEPLSDSC
jgi:hypothetical protein